MTVLFENQQGKEQEEGRGGGKIECQLSEVNTRAVFRGQSELFKWRQN
jgi:hypothetical protein